MLSFLRGFRNLLEQPMKVALASLLVALASLLAEGSLVNLWNLKVEKQKLLSKFEATEAKNILLQSKIKRAQSSDKFIGHEARERLDLVSEDELIFIFDN